jgi:hypothetical protein
VRIFVSDLRTVIFYPFFGTLTAVRVAGITLGLEIGN